MSPIRLSDSELDCVMNAARVLPVSDRDPFLRAIAEALAGHVLGEGLVARTVAEVQKRFWRAPELDERPGKYGRL